MGRIREFDTDDALESAMQVFWEMGYARTSVRDLVSRTGVAHAGIYSVFGDKLGVFTAALEKYARENVGEMFAELERSGSGRVEIEAVFDRLVSIANAGNFRRGCFLANSAVDMAHENPAIGKIIQSVVERQLRAFKAALKHSKATGQIDKGVNVETTASALVATFYGMSALSRAGVSAKTLKDAAQAAKSHLR